MSAIPSPLPPATPTEPVFRLSVEQYHAMIDAGVLTDDDPVELLEGVLVFKMPKKPKHRIALAKLRRALERLLPAGMSLQIQEPITLSDSEPEPDGAAFRGQPEDYSDAHPGPQDILLVIEVADATLRRDRGVKLRTYARASIPVYWIINLIDRCVEIYTRPDATAAEPAYLEKQVRRESDSIPITIAGEECGTISVRELLP